MNCVQALAVAAAALVASGEVALEPLFDAPAYVERQAARGEALMRAAAEDLEARIRASHKERGGHRYARALSRLPDSQIHAARLL